MLHAHDWTSALFGLIHSRGAKRADASGGDASQAPPAKDTAGSSDEDLEPFHLDDPEIAERLRERADALYRTPPHAHLVFPMLKVR